MYRLFPWDATGATQISNFRSQISNEENTSTKPKPEKKEV
jgi:hypothetical protein